MSRLSKAWGEIKKGAPRELAIFLLMSIFAVVAALIGFPIIWLLSVMPVWTFWVVFATWLVWLIFGDTLDKSWSAYRGKDQ